MIETTSLHLCAGVMFSLLVEGKKTCPAHRRSWGADSDLTNPQISDLLVEVVFDKVPESNFRTQKGQVSTMGSCKEPKLGVTTPFYSEKYQEGLRRYLDRVPFNLLLRWDRFLHTVLGDDSADACQTFTDRLLAAVEADEAFPGYQDEMQGRFVTRDELLAPKPEIYFQTFTLGVWAWICLNAPSNQIDPEALKKWKAMKVPPRAHVTVLTEDEIKNKKIIPISAETEKEMTDTEPEVESVALPDAAELREKLTDLLIELRLRMKPEDLENIFAEFCAVTWLDRQTEFTATELERYFQALDAVKNKTSIPFGTFIDLLVNGLGLMDETCGRYSFRQWSIQEYFCALYYSKVTDKKLHTFGQELNYRFTGNPDNGSVCLSLLYKLIPRPVEETILLDAMRRAVYGCNGENGYRTFLQRNYPEIRYCVGDVPSGQALNSAQPYVYRFAVKALGLSSPEPLTLPADSQFKIQTDEAIESTGTLYLIETEKLFADEEKHQELVKALYAPECPLRQEYDRVCDWTKRTEQQVEDKLRRMRFKLIDELL